MPYWLNHALIALGICLVIWPFFGLSAGALTGASFYAGREIAQWEAKGYWDWPGLVAPVALMAVILTVATFAPKF